MEGMRIVLGPIVTMPVIFSLLTGFFTVMFICIFTRFSTGSKFRQETTTGGSQFISVLPYWIPWIGHSLSFAIGGQEFLSQCSWKYKQAAFAIVLRGQKYTIITAPSLVEQLEDTDGLGLSTYARQYKLRYLFGDRSSGSNLKKTLACYNNDRMMLMGSDGIIRTQNHVDKIVRALESTAYNLISFNESWIDQSKWERTSKTIIDAESSTVAEVSFFPLIEGYIGEISTTALLGRNFLENNPDFLEDLHLWNSKGTLFMNQVALFLPQMSGPAAARQRVLRSLRRFSDILRAYTAGDDPGSGWSDLSDVSPFISERMERSNDGSKSSSDVSVDAAFLWAFNKPNTVIAWLLYRIYSDTALLAEVRKDIKPFVRVEYVKSELRILEPPRVVVDSKGLVKKSRLLRDVMNKTIRLHINTIIYGVTTKALSLDESHDDATMLGKNGPDSYILRKGELIGVPHGAEQLGQGLEHGPGTFNPAGFNSLTNLKVPSAKAAGTSHTNHGFGVGRVICPGRALAEQEIMIIAAVILSIWEVDCKWQWPGQQPGLCSTLPLEDIRIKMLRRKAEDDFK
jgi:hypothetical protein